ncbi:CRISPR system precrRNA processing endoribonuclease RAMP protein Cas6 [Rehaibacterium terrae]|jgi:hypothetical protein|uniref:CRISPR-associated protein Cas6 C-terminal domain-containing protein n=1 Tax=Rehaibacterium terrae TaxID=1341696 RepID=A0A7W8DF27_9GAMM|nr:CRISPR system precrRNA processing endoribonuclease RAMP protein Cas6 [Rehaibacterium terrae]MBB5015889.1 hypothetical protein [Rehaibacterium terrae]
MLELSVYRLHLRGSGAVATPPPLAIWRSAWGAALRQMACVTGAKQCTGCPVPASCNYRRIFDPLPPPAHALGSLSAVPPPYVLNEVSATASGCCLEFVLMGPAQEQIGLVLASLAKTGRNGVGKARLMYAPDRLMRLEQGRWCPDSSVPTQAPSLCLGPLTVAAPRERGELVIELQSPLRLQEGGQILRPDRFTASRWLIGLVRRLGLLCDLYGKPLGLDFAQMTAWSREVTMPEAELRWMHETRWSSRQGQCHPTSGIVGRFRMSGPLAPFEKLLQIGVHLHVGKQAAFGNGRYRVAAVTTADSASL